ncbi:MAG: hypothetical protein QN120_06820 [Armatimonadota bacterium]|nr:hypothetical protein [Armatimonadota bacterium]
MAGRRSPAIAEGRRAAARHAAFEMLFVERARLAEPVVVELDRPLAYRPRLVGFWRGSAFHLITRVVATRHEHDAVYHRVITDHGAFDIRHVRRMDPGTLRAWRAWELCAELDTVPVARLP